MMMMRRPCCPLVSATLACRPVSRPAGASSRRAGSGRRAARPGRPSTPRSTPINNLPNPYETVRNFGTLPDGRKWGSVSAVQVDIDGKSIWAGDRCGTNSCAGSKVDPIVKLDPSGKVVKSLGAGQILWPHGIDVDKQGNVWVVDARSATDAELKQFPDAAGKGHTVTKFSPDGKVLLVLGTPGKAGNPPEAFTEPNDVAIAPTAASSSANRMARSSSTRTRPTASAGSRSSRRRRQVHQELRRLRLRPESSSAGRTRSPSTRRAVSSSPIAATAASRSSIRRASTSTPGTSSAASAA